MLLERLRIAFRCDPHRCVAETAVERLSVPIAGEARPIYLRHWAGSPTYLRHPASCPTYLRHDR